MKQIMVNKKKKNKKAYRIKKNHEFEKKKIGSRSTLCKIYNKQKIY